jgi:CHAT domain-containing protein/tetratricopeptide (TPR) repeat protein
MIRFIILCLLLNGIATAANPEELAMSGKYAEAADLYLQQARAFDARGERTTAIPLLMNAATCMKMSGDISAACIHVTTAGEWMGTHPSKETRLEWLALKGSILALGKRPALALAPLEEALKMADREKDPELATDLYNDLGIALSASEKHKEAMTAFDQAADLADRPGGGGKFLRAKQNQLVAAYQEWKMQSDLVRNIEEVGSWPGESAVRLQVARSGIDSCLASCRAPIASAGKSEPLGLQLTLTAAMVSHRIGDVPAANQLFATALERARSSGNLRYETSALLGLVEQYVGARRHPEALRLLDEVRTLPKPMAEPEIARMEILTAEARHAIAPAANETGDAIRRAIAAVETIRSDLARSQYVSDLGRGFREFSGRPYLLLADHLLLRSAVECGRDPKQLRAARDAVESFKSWELNDFYRDDCVNLALSTARNLDQVGDPSVAVIYLIPLDGRTELFVGHDTGLRRFSSPIGSVDLLAAARRFRYRLESDYGTFRFFEDAELLHRHLIKPALNHLQSLGVKHLVFILDGALGNIPLGALYDPERQRYLLEEYSISIAPNLSLLAPAPSSSAARPLLAAGLSVAVGNYQAIPAVSSELDNIAGMYADKVVLKNGKFTSAALRENLLNLPVDVVHLATHGEFLGRADECFLLTHDGKIRLDQVEEMIRPKKFVGIPVGLLCLSACRTAAGDDRAALGLAGASVKSGARSVLATLWNIQDNTTAEIMTSFHRLLCDNPKQGKAEALRQAQLSILRKDPNSHPSLWAPFVLVGAWQ